jgi:hypothetical protein
MEFIIIFFSSTSACLQFVFAYNVLVFTFI